jgi:hypothetical protein
MKLITSHYDTSFQQKLMAINSHCIGVYDG